MDDVEEGEGTEGRLAWTPVMVAIRPAGRARPASCCPSPAGCARYCTIPCARPRASRTRRRCGPAAWPQASWRTASGGCSYVLGFHSDPYEDSRPGVRIGAGGRSSGRHGVDPLADPCEVRPEPGEPRIGLTQLLPFRADEAAVGGDALAHARGAAADLFLELFAQRRGEARADVGNAFAHLRLRPLPLRGDDKEAARGDHAREQEAGKVRRGSGGRKGDDGAEPQRARA